LHGGGKDNSFVRKGGSKLLMQKGESKENQKTDKTSKWDSARIRKVLKRDYKNY